jgi:hypothetical protein
VSFESDERQIRASLGLHRGRRALGSAMVAIAGLALLLRIVVPDEQPVLVTPPGIQPNAPAVAPLASRAPVRRRSLRTQTQAPVRAAAPVASSTERSAPPAEQPAERVASSPERSAPPAEQPAERVVPPAEQPSEALVPPPPAVPPAESPAAPEVDIAAPDEPPAEPLPERAAPVAWEGSGESIARAIADAKRAAVRKCFEHELKQQPKLAGTVVVELELAAPDRVEALRVSDDLNRPEFTHCVTSAMQGLRFAALDEDISVRVPYTLRPVPR